MAAREFGRAAAAKWVAEAAVCQLYLPQLSRDSHLEVVLPK
jgi:hypothetical protein